MTTFTPVNNLELKLRDVLTNKNTPLWNFYTPLAATPLWIIVKNHPELDGSDLVVPPGQNPEVCTFREPNASYIGIYTSRGRAQEVFTKMKLSPQALTIVSAPGYQVLKYLSTFEEESLWINCGLKDCQYHLDPDMVDILLARPEPTAEPAPSRPMFLDSTDAAEQHLAPLREFLGRQPKVRAAWIYRQLNEPAVPASHQAYEVALVMEDPADNSLLHEVGVMVKALTPIEMDWTTGVWMADDQSLRNLMKQKAPFYARADFLKLE